MIVRNNPIYWLMLRGQLPRVSAGSNIEFQDSIIVTIPVFEKPERLVLPHYSLIVVEYANSMEAALAPLQQLLALRLAVGLWILIPAAGVRIPEGQPTIHQVPFGLFPLFLCIDRIGSAGFDPCRCGVCLLKAAYGGGMACQLSAASVNPARAARD
jgi:hypothetical protein